MNIKKIMKLNYILIIFLILCSTFLFNNKTIEKEKTKNNLKPLDYEGQTYRLVTSAENVQVPVPKGYVASDITGEYYVAPSYRYTSNTKTKIHDGGFVIYQLTDEELETDPNGTNVIINDTNKDTAQRTRNQYVWVPVQNINDITRSKTANDGIMQFGQNYIFNTMYIMQEYYNNEYCFREPRLSIYNDMTKYWLQRYSNINKRENYLNNMQEEYNRMIKSINKYKGFYIGRYETGDDITHSSSKSCYINPRVVRYNSNIGYVSWYNSYIDLERLSGKTEKYVETGLLYDSLWDYTLKWFNTTNTRSYEDLRGDSGTWGNYINNSKTTQSGSTSIARTGEIETITYNEVTYSDYPTSSNNIFDIAGNVEEWTRGKDSDSYRKVRGSNYYSNSYDLPGCFSGASTQISDSSVNGARSMLFIR